MISFILASEIFHILVVCAKADAYKYSNYRITRYQNDHDIPRERLSPLDFQNVEKLSPFSPTTDPTEKAGGFEGDIVIMMHEESSSVKNAIKDVNDKWKNGTVPYLISPKFNEHDRSVVARAFLEFQRQTCISFTPRGAEKDYIMITNDGGCSSQVGRVGGMQRETLGDGCIYPGIVMHELMHTVGFWHEQSRWDRNEHVSVHYENIQPGMEDNFRKMTWQEIQNLSAPYDTSSIMHYGPLAFSKNRQKHLKTITPKVPNGNMGQRQNFSETDVYKINKLYNCNKESTDDQYDSSNNSPQNCKDNHHNCEKWAINGECKTNPDWMLANCKNSCKQCRVTCSNNNKHCETWAANGECTKNPGYMKTNCAKACQQCQ